MNKLVLASYVTAIVVAVAFVARIPLEREPRARHETREIAKGITFAVTCDTTAAGIVVQEAAPTGNAWTSLYCANATTTPVFWGFSQGATFDTTTAPSVMTPSGQLVPNGFAVNVRRGLIVCKTAISSAKLTCNAGGPS